MERQKHGFKFEKKYVKENDLIIESEYTSIIDAIDKEDNVYQIKCIKLGSSIDLGDIFRNSQKEKDFYLVVGFWKDKRNNIVEIYKLFIDKNKWNKLFEFDAYDKMKDWIKNKVSNDYNYDNQWKKECSYYKKLWNVIERKIQPRFKRDHKSQKRIQCAINKTDFYNYFLKEFPCWEENID